MAGVFVLATLVLVLTISAAGKLRDPQAFEGVVYNYRLLPRALVKPVARSLPGVELLLLVGLLVPAARPAAATALVVLLATYTAAIAIQLARGRRDMDCGCLSSVLRERLSGWHVVRNAVLVAMAAAAGGLWPFGAAVTEALDGAGAFEAIAGGAAALCAALLYIAMSILSLRPRIASDRAHTEAARAETR